MKSTKRLRFMSLAWIEGLSFNPANPKGIHLKKLGRDAILITLAPQAPEDDPFGHRRGLECKVRRSYEVTSNLHHFVDKLNARVLVPYPGVNLKLPHVGRRGELIAADGTLTDGYRFPWQHYPEDLQAICQRALKELQQDTTRLIKLLMWFFNTSHAHEPVQHASLYCNTRGKTYYAIGQNHSSGGDWRNDLVWNATNSEGFSSVWKSRSDESLAHELFREAGSLIHSAPRSALLMLATALEAGVKTYISEREPITQWLLTETQSPPILKVLRDFIPTLTPAISASLDSWSALRSLFGRLTKLIEARNRLTHRGTWDLELESLIEFREDVSDILYILDYLRGAEWARNNIRAATCQALNWPKPVTTQTQLRATVTVVTE
ncbi:hypothetical protein [Bradyrhizobium diazoefficiens]